MDYRLTDEYADPPGPADACHTEKLVRLEGGFLCYRPPAEAPAVNPPPSGASGAVTFGSFNNLSKVNDTTIALWANLLKRLPQSRLLVKAYGLAADSARRDLLERFARHEISADRLELCPPEDAFAAHLARYHQVDIALDTFPYNGTTTTCEALWMGVPVISLAGKAHAARSGASILSHVGLPDLVAATPEEYLAKALALAGDAERRRELRAGLRARMESSPLIDAAGFTRRLEAAYLEMWTTYSNQKDIAMRLHIGGKVKMPGWKILNVQPGENVDFVGDCSDLSQFGDQSVDEIYASHVLEHLGYREPRRKTLKEFYRVLKKGGSAKIAVPDFETLCRLFIDSARTPDERMLIMQMAFGGQVDEYDFHYVGLTEEFMRGFLAEAGFSRVERTGDFGLLDDDSTIRVAGVPISLNVIAYK
jgi:predicted SAM-dependent methyltransferase